jgi:hypothetical protein
MTSRLVEAWRRRAIEAERRLDIAIALAAETLLNRADEPYELPPGEPLESGHAIRILNEIRAVGDPDTEWVMAMIVKRTADRYLERCQDEPEP